MRWKPFIIGALLIALGFTACQFVGGHRRIWSSSPFHHEAAARQTQTPMTQARAGTEGLPNGWYKLAVPGRPYRFPQDHAAHPNYATEWWYYTGHLRDASGKTYGFQITFFRVGVAPPGRKRASAWAVSNIYFAHLAVTDEAGQTYHYYDRVSRGSVGEAGAREDHYSVFIGDWTGGLQGNTHLLHAVQDGFGIDLSATPAKPPVIHGEAGVSQKAKGRGRASYYYSYTRMDTTGTLYIGGKPLSVTGSTWFDHEFGSNQLASYQTGWDWFSLQMEDGREAMLYLMRDAGNRANPYSSGTLVGADGKAAHLKLSDFHVDVLGHWKSPATGADYPARWHIAIPRQGWDVTVIPTVADQELRTGGAVGVTYWEGSVSVEGAVSGAPARGQGYVELTGYSAPMRQTF